MAEWPEHEVLDVPTSWGTTRVYRRNGGGRAVVLLHGAGVTSAMWAGVVRGIGRPVYAVDVLGDAGGGVQTRPLTDMNAWLSEVLDGLGLDDPLLVGVSYGAWVAALHPVGEVVLVEPAAGAFAPYRVRAVLYAVAAKVSGGEWAWRRYLRWISGVEPSAAAVIALTHWRTGLVLPRRVDLARVRARATVLVGRRSRAQDARKVVRRVRELPGVVVRVFDGGHGVPPDLADHLP
ncbi:alpha/beta fold hydrolase [Saccharothrix sp. Mg75]|uniref:alpha/beta fold hydrolase n=1 Tax=Saccharothrix sp. Mg75 TaxID=3445357 RepID=UPI003EEFA865